MNHVRSEAHSQSKKLRLDEVGVLRTQTSVGALDTRCAQVRRCTVASDQRDRVIRAIRGGSRRSAAGALPQGRCLAPIRDPRHRVADPASCRSPASASTSTSTRASSTPTNARTAASRARSCCPGSPTWTRSPPSSRTASSPSWFRTSRTRRPSAARSTSALVPGHDDDKERLHRLSPASPVTQRSGVSRGVSDPQLQDGIGQPVIESVSVVAYLGSSVRHWTECEVSTRNTRSVSRRFLLLLVSRHDVMAR